LNLKRAAVKANGSATQLDWAVKTATSGFFFLLICWAGVAALRSAQHGLSPVILFAVTAVTNL
jgi:hypothetical protein